jgi:hypothetical protein
MVMAGHSFGGCSVIVTVQSRSSRFQPPGT